MYVKDQFGSVFEKSLTALSAITVTTSLHPDAIAGVATQATGLPLLYPILSEEEDMGDTDAIDLDVTVQCHSILEDGLEEKVWEQTHTLRATRETLLEYASCVQ